MFELRCALLELWRRWPRTLLGAGILAAAVAVAAAVGALSAALRQAQAELTRPLRSLGADLLLLPRAGTEGAPAPAAALPDVARLGPPGSRFAVERVLPGAAPTFVAADLGAAARVPGVQGLDGLLLATVLRQEGTVPAAEARVRTGGEQLAVEQEIPPLTPAEQAALAAALERAMADLARQGVAPLSPEWLQAMWRAAEAALPERFRRVRVTLTTPEREVRQAVAVERLDLRTEAWTALGLSPEAFRRLAGSRLEAGSGLSGAPDEVVVSRAFARARGLRVGTRLTLSGRALRVVGVVAPSAALPADLYLPLPTLQALAGQPGRLSAALVRVAAGADVERVRADLARALPHLAAVGEDRLASQVARGLAELAATVDRFALAAAAVSALGALAAAAALAVASVERRLAQIGVLRALGWSDASVVLLLLGESLTVALLGGAAGLATARGALAWGAELAVALPAWAVAPAWALLGGPAAAGGAAGGGTLVLHLRLSPGLAAAALGLGLVAGAVAGVAAAARVLRLSPLEALRRGG